MPYGSAEEGNSCREHDEVGKKYTGSGYHSDQASNFKHRQLRRTCKMFATLLHSKNFATKKAGPLRTSNTLICNDRKTAVLQDNVVNVDEIRFRKGNAVFDDALNLFCCFR